MVEFNSVIIHVMRSYSAKIPVVESYYETNPVYLKGTVNEVQVPLNIELVQAE